MPYLNIRYHVIRAIVSQDRIPLTLTVQPKRANLFRMPAPSSHHSLEEFLEDRAEHFACDFFNSNEAYQSGAAITLEDLMNHVVSALFAGAFYWKENPMIWSLTIGNVPQALFDAGNDFKPSLFGKTVEAGQKGGMCKLKVVAEEQSPCSSPHSPSQTCYAVVTFELCGNGITRRVRLENREISDDKASSSRQQHEVRQGYIAVPRNAGGVPIVQTTLPSAEVSESEQHDDRENALAGQKRKLISAVISNAKRQCEEIPQIASATMDQSAASSISGNGELPAAEDNHDEPSGHEGQETMTLGVLQEDVPTALGLANTTPKDGRGLFIDDSESEQSDEIEDFTTGQKRKDKFALNNDAKRQREGNVEPAPANMISQAEGPANESGGIGTTEGSHDEPSEHEDQEETLFISESEQPDDDKNALAGQKRKGEPAVGNAAKRHRNESQPASVTIVQPIASSANETSELPAAEINHDELPEHEDQEETLFIEQTPYPSSENSESEQSAESNNDKPSEHEAQDEAASPFVVQDKIGTPPKVSQDKPSGQEAEEEEPELLGVLYEKIVSVETQRRQLAMQHVDHGTTINKNYHMQCALGDVLTASGKALAVAIELSEACRKAMALGNQLSEHVLRKDSNI
ncbi:MAG: hypothetical protein Q9169_004278 [Polycauliona sp. 2 TL-2023]